MRCSHLDGHRRRPRIAFAVRCSCFRCAAVLSACTLPAYLRLENHPFRRTRASDVDAALPCLRPILANRQSRRQVEASIDRGQSSRTHATGHAVESPSLNTKWRRPRYTLNGRNIFSAGHGGSLQTPIKMMCQAMTSNCFNTHCNTLSSKLNPDAPPFIPNPNPIHNKNDTASIGSTRGKSRRHGQHHIMMDKQMLPI